MARWGKSDQPTHLRALGPRTVVNYVRILERAYGPGSGPIYGPVPAHVMGWPEGSKSILRNALIRAWATAGNSDRGHELAASIPASHRIKRARIELPEEVLTQIEKAAGRRRHARDEALVLIPLRLGLRSEEFLTLSRAQVEAAIASGSLTFVRKGAKEATLPVRYVKAFFNELLATPAATGRGPDAGTKARHEWRVLGEVLAGAHATYATRYNLFNRLVKKVGKAAGVPGLSPHRLRHGFATRMHRDGAPMGVVQAALGHASVMTTERYVHVGAADVEKWTRK